MIVIVTLNVTFQDVALIKATVKNSRLEAVLNSIYVMENVIELVLTKNVNEIEAIVETMKL